MKVVPYALGELANWGEDLEHDDFNRAYGIVGVRATLPFWAVDPTIQSDLFNVHGVAHKIDLSVDFSLQQATSNLANLPLYDQIQRRIDSALRAAIRVQHLWHDTGHGPADRAARLPGDLRSALLLAAPRVGRMGHWPDGNRRRSDRRPARRRSAAGRPAAAPPGDQHIIDWITLDTEAEIYPDSKQNFGSVMGLFDYDFHWYVGDRVTLVSSGAADFFNGGQQEISFGAYLNRPSRGNVYLGFYSLNGDIRSNVIATAFTYRMSEKWAATFGTTFDVSPSVNIGQSFTVTRIGESFLTTVGVTVDASRGTVGANLMIEPRALGRERLVKAHGLEIPAAGVNGLGMSKKTRQFARQRTDAVIRPAVVWLQKFRRLMRGVKLGVRGQSSFFVHFFITASVVATALTLNCNLVDWCILLVCITIVLAAEMFNGALNRSAGPWMNA